MRYEHRVVGWSGLLGGLLLLALVLALPGVVVAQEAGAGATEDGAHGAAQQDQAEPGIAATDAGDAPDAQRTERVWAAVGLSRNPVAFCMDPQGNVYVAESERAGQAVSDTRNLRHLNGVEEDLRMLSVEDRLAQINRWTANGDFATDFFTRTSDQVRIVRDTDGDGIADASAIFAASFNDPLDGIGAGLLWLDGGLYYTCIPHVWRLEDRDGDGDADETTAGERESLSYGYGIRWAFYGHDLHGLVMGPDGRIYFSTGDRGFNVINQEGETLRHVERGAVLRMWPDGSELEVFCVGLRNPQELAFDNYGNLYTGDNNCDAGDKARFIHLVQGGDCGWHQDVQSLPDRGPWLREKMWELRRAKDDPTQPAWIIPPIAHIGHGPSGLAHYPGTGDTYPANGSFLMADFPGGVRHIVVQPDGAWSRVASVEMAVSGKDVTDVCWGYDGRVYMSEWGGGWGPNPNGYIFTVTNDAAHADAEQAALIAQVQALFAQGFEHRGDDELIALLGHADQRVRLHAQYALAKRDGVVERVDTVAQDTDAAQMQRIHAVWTLGMIARRVPAAVDAIAPLLTDADPHIRTQAAKTLGDLRYEATEQYVAMLEDEHAQARFYASIALGRIEAEEAIVPIFEMLDANNNEDPMLRHAGSYAMSLMPGISVMRAYEWRDDRTGEVPLGPAARLGVVLSLRRNADRALTRFMFDDDPVVAAEAARAIYDMQVIQAMPEFATMLDRYDSVATFQGEPVMRRLIATCVQLGGAGSAQRLAMLVRNRDVDARWRILALQELAHWDQTKNRDDVWGHWRPRAPHDLSETERIWDILVGDIPATARGANELTPLLEAMRLKHVTDASADELAAIAHNADAAELLRRTAIDKLAERHPHSEAAKEALAHLAADADAPDELKNHARVLLADLDAGWAARSYLEALANGSTAEQQQAITQLAQLAQGDNPQATQAIDDLSQQLKPGTLDPALWLETYEAARRSGDANVAGRAVSYFENNTRPGDQYIAQSLHAGGDIERGRLLAYESETANCLRCHSFRAGDGGGAVGPLLEHIGSDRPPSYLLAAMLDPNADIAQGYQTIALTLADGSIIAGRIVEENAALVMLANGEGDVREIPILNITKRTPQTISLMTPMADRLNAHELRDLVAFLTSLQDARGPAPIATAPGSGRSPNAMSSQSTTGIHNPMVGVNTALLLPMILLAILVSLGGFALWTFWLNQKLEPRD